MEKKLKELFESIKAPDMKEDIMMAIHEKKQTKPKMKLRAITVIAAVLVLFGVTAGAAVVGGVKLLPGVTVLFRDEAGNLVQPDGYHLEKGADAQLSGTALTNIAPYVAGPRENISFETDSRAEMERFLDMTLHIPTAAEELEGESLKYVMRAPGEDGQAETISVSLYGDSVECSFNIYIRVNPFSLTTGSTAEFSEYTLPDGTPVTLAVFRTKSGNGWYLMAFYTIDDVLYHLNLDGGSKKELLAEAKAILDTVQ